MTGDTVQSILSRDRERRWLWQQRDLRSPPRDITKLSFPLLANSAALLAFRMPSAPAVTSIVAAGDLLCLLCRRPFSTRGSQPEWGTVCGQPNACFCMIWLQINGSQSASQNFRGSCFRWPKFQQVDVPAPARRTSRCNPLAPPARGPPGPCNFASGPNRTFQVQTPVLAAGTDPSG